MRSSREWGQLWTDVKPPEREESVRAFISDELEESRGFVRRLLAEHHRLGVVQGESPPSARKESRGRLLRNCCLEYLPSLAVNELEAEGCGALTDPA